MTYAGPPASDPPPAGWRPPEEPQPSPPRRLPPQEHPALDAAEREARKVTGAIAALAGVIALVLVCVLLGRLAG